MSCDHKRQIVDGGTEGGLCFYLGYGHSFEYFKIVRVDPHPQEHLIRFVYSLDEHTSPLTRRHSPLSLSNWLLDSLQLSKHSLLIGRAGRAEGQSEAR